MARRVARHESSDTSSMYLAHPALMFAMAMKCMAKSLLWSVLTSCGVFRRHSREEHRTGVGQAGTVNRAMLCWARHANVAGRGQAREQLSRVQHAVRYVCAHMLEVRQPGDLSRPRTNTYDVNIHAIIVIARATHLTLEPPALGGRCRGEVDGNTWDKPLAVTALAVTALATRATGEDLKHTASSTKAVRVAVRANTTA